MISRQGIFCAFLFIALAALALPQQLNYSLKSEQTQATMSGGVSYDLLRYPTNVSFDQPEGYLSFNIPLDLSTNKLNLGDYLKGSNESFTPKIAARQRLNYSFRVDVPMLRGVLIYAQTENVNFEMSMNLGSNINETIDQKNIPLGSGVSGSAYMNLNGAINLPIHYEMGWRTQTFGYAFKPRKDLMVAINLHQHLFEATANGTVNTNLLGNVALDLGSLGTKQDLPINYSEENVGGQISGRYTGSAWSPAIGIKWKRLILASRFGVNTKVKGHFTMRWKVPFFVNPQPKKFGVDENKLVIPMYARAKGDTTPVDQIQLARDFQGLKDNLARSATDSFALDARSDAEFNIPSGQTIAVELVRDHVVLSYTFTYGGSISGYHQNQAGDVGDTHLDLGFDVNQIVTLTGTFGRSRITLGGFMLDFYETGKEHWLSRGAGTYDSWGGVPIPIVNCATSFGNTARVLLELDALPIPAIKSGLVYHF
jgi:hypothetical protein